MAKAEDLTDKEFGFLKVLERTEDRTTPSGQKRKFWLCKCLICGGKKEVAAQDLKRGSVKSCGCWQSVKGRAARNIKICAECGKSFECPPSDKTVTCSAGCRKMHAKKRQTGTKRSDSTRKKISGSAKGRDMSDLQAIATEAAKKSPRSGRFITNVNAKMWHLVSPDGQHFRFRSLNFWLRENCREFFGCEPDSREFKNAASGLRGAKRATMGGKYPCCTYKGWRVLPTDDDYV